MTVNAHFLENFLVGKHKRAVILSLSKGSARACTPCLARAYLAFAHVALRQAQYDSQRSLFRKFSCRQTQKGCHPEPVEGWCEGLYALLSPRIFGLCARRTSTSS